MCGNAWRMAAGIAMPWLLRIQSPDEKEQELFSKKGEGKLVISMPNVGIPKIQVSLILTAQTMTRTPRMAMKRMIRTGLNLAWYYFQCFDFTATRDITLLVHGLESDWVEEEMMSEDVEFIRDVLEQKVQKAFAKAGIKKKVWHFFLYVKSNSLYRSNFLMRTAGWKDHSIEAYSRWLYYSSWGIEEVWTQLVQSISGLTGGWWKVSYLMVGKSRALQWPGTLHQGWKE